MRGSLRATPALLLRARANDSSGVEMWYVAPPVREKKPVVLIYIESKDDSASEHECPHVKKVIPYVQIFSIIITLFSLITFVHKRD
jgi:hypothetical protein